MNLEPVFSELLISSLQKWSARKVDECILSISVPLSQKDPLTEYKQEAYNFFVIMLTRIRHRVVYFVLRSRIIIDVKN